MSANENNGLGRTPGMDQSFDARSTGQNGIDNMIDGRDDPNRGPLDRAANALDGRDDPNRGPLDRAANALDGRDDPNRGPLDRAANALDVRDDPNRGPLDRAANALDGRDDPNRGPLDRTANSLDGRDDPNRGPLDRAANAIDGALDGHDDPNRGPLDRAANALGAGGAAAAGGTAGAMTGTIGAGGIASAVFDTEAEAQQAVTALRSAGVADSSLSLIAQHRGKTTTTTGDGDVTDDGHSNLLRGIFGGGALGAGLAVAALAIPGVGPLAAAGAIAASVVPEAMAIGAVAGAALGTLNETLTKHGVSEEDASYYGDRIKSGGVFVSVDTRSAGITAAQVNEILHRNGGHSSSRARIA